MAAQSTPLDSTGNDATSSQKRLERVYLRVLNEKNGRPPNGLLFDEAAREVVSPRSLYSTSSHRLF